jgi:hypothetical protein
LASADRAAVPSADGGPRRERAWWIAVTAGAAAVLMFCYLRIAGTVPVLSDGAANALQAQDMLHGNLLLHGWWVTDVSFLTTELPQYALVIAVAGLRPEVVHICAAITYTLLVLLAAYVARGRASGAEAVVRALTAAAIMLAPELGAPSWVLLSDPDHVGTGVPLLLLLLLIDRPRASRWVPVAAFVLLTWASIADPLAEAIGALPLAAVCLARVAVGRPRRISALRTYWYELSLAAAAVLAALATKVVDDLIPALGGYQINKGVSGLIPLGEIPGNGPLVLRSVLALFGASFQDAPHGRQHAINLAFAAVHLAGLALVVAAVVVAAWGLLRTLAWLARGGSGGPDGADGVAGSGGVAGAGGRGGVFAVGDLVADVTVVAVVICVATYFTLFKLNNIYAAHEIGPVLSLGAALAGRRFGGPLARACGLRTGTAPGGTSADATPADATSAGTSSAGTSSGGTSAGGTSAGGATTGEHGAGHQRPRAGGRLARLAVLPALTALLACYCAMLGFAAAQQQTPPANAALAVWLQGHGLRSGLAGYWEASVVTVETEGAITMGSVTPLRNGRLAPRHWEQDMRIFDPATHRANFVVLAPDSPMSESDVLRTFGPAAHVYRFETYTILVWGKNLLPDLGPAIN